ncbi:hypothetical protein DPEC_G00026840 [Dallia pectoralis]|uniref:Uncharacterized protein n=1 Tax=Dallia pectoralis TaxID=75939 RepID=A0ACC2HHN5_DALPE|nr:hypothetical protein DPEC_G00026840 [Dallia pectoralis]
MAEDIGPDQSRPQMYLFGCTLKSDKREFKVEVDDDDADHQLSLKAVCLGAEAEDTFHTVEIEGFTFDGKTTRIPLAVLKPTVLPSMSLGGFEITPPVTFRLQSGCGPVYISGQHFVSVKDSDDEEEENNTSPVKRPSTLSSGKQPAPKKLKMDSDDDDDSEDDDDDDDDSIDEDDADVKVHKVAAKPTTMKSPEPLGKTPKHVTWGQNGSPGKQETPSAKTQEPEKRQETSRKEMFRASPSILEIKKRLESDVNEGKNLPKTEQKFENYARSSFKMFDKDAVKELWNFAKMLKKKK